MVYCCSKGVVILEKTIDDLLKICSDSTLALHKDFDHAINKQLAILKSKNVPPSSFGVILYEMAISLFTRCAVIMKVVGEDEQTEEMLNRIPDKVKENMKTMDIEGFKSSA